MKKNVLTKALSLLLALTLLTGLFPAGVLAADLPETLVTSLTELYSGDETRAREDLEALSAAGLLDGDGRLVALDIIEDGESAELSALAERITKGEEVGEITVNGSAATPEQIVQISQVNAAIEVAQLLDEEIDVTNEHVENLENLLTGIQDGSVDLENALKTGSMSLQSTGNAPLLGADGGEKVDMTLAANKPEKLTLTEDGSCYIAPYINGSVYNPAYAFHIDETKLQNKEQYFVDYPANSASDQKPVTENNVKRDSFDWENAIIGTDDNPTYTTVTAILPLKSDDTVRTWLANEQGLINIAENGIGVEMELPDYGKVNLTRYFSYMFFCSTATQGNYHDKYHEFYKFCYPAYLLEGGNGKPDALVTRFVAPFNLQNEVRMDTLCLYVDPNGTAVDFVQGWSNTRIDATGNHYWVHDDDRWWRPETSVIPGRSLRYFVQSGNVNNGDKYIERPEGSWEKVDGAFIRLKKPENPDFPYVFSFFTASPSFENWGYQLDLELMVTEDLYRACQSQILYMGEDLDLRVAVRVSNRKRFTTAYIDPFFVRQDAYLEPCVCNWLVNEESSGSLVLEKTEGNEMEVTVIPTALTTSTPAQINLKYYPCGVRLNDNVRPHVSFTSIYLPAFHVRDVEPFLMIPRSSRIRQTMMGLGTDILFSSNITQRTRYNPTMFKAELYKIGDSPITANEISDTLPAGAQQINVSGWGLFPSTEHNPVTHISVPGTALSSAGAYAVKISAQYYDEGGAQTPYSAIAYLNVKQTPAKIKLDKLTSSYCGTNNIPDITYTLDSSTENTEVKYTVQPSGEAVSEMMPPEGSKIPFTPSAFEGLKKAYTFTVYARNSEEDPWSTDSLLLTVYNTDMLKLLMSDVAIGDIGGTTGGKEGDGTAVVSDTVELDNSSKIAELVDTEGEGAGYQISGYDFDQLRADVGLQRVISANYGSGTWGVISDKMQWSYKEANGRTSDAVTLNHEEGGTYSDLRSYSYTSYAPTSDFLIVATDDRSDSAPVTITATHAATGMKKSVNVTVNTLKDKLCLFRFNPKAVTEVIYTNDAGVERKLKSNDNGELAVYEPDGIKSAVVTKSEYNGETYVGTILHSDLVSGEKDITKLELYPCNNLTLKPISSQTLTFLKPDGKPYTGSVTLRGGVYAGDVYCPEAGFYTSKGGSFILRKDASVNVSNGKATLWFDADQFVSGDRSKTWEDGLKFVFEYRFEKDYQPGYVIVDADSNDPAAYIVNLKAIRGSAAVPQIIRQEFQQYMNGVTPTSYKRDVVDHKDNIGISRDFGKAVLYTYVALPNEAVGTDAAGYSTYAGSDVVKFAFYKSDDDTKITGQTDLLGETIEVAQITNLDQLSSASYFVFPFSSFPVIRSTYTMTNENLTANGITDEGDYPTPTARIKGVFTRGEMTVANINMPFGVTNRSHQPTLSTQNTGDGSAVAIGKDVRKNLRETTDIGAIFRSINVNDMIRKGFVFLGNLTGKGGDNPINLMILPTADPATFRIIAFVGANQRSGDADDGVSVNFNTQDLAEDMANFRKEMEELNKKKDNENDSGGSGSMQFNFYGTIILEARIGVADGKWSIAFRGGNVGTNVKGKYEWGQTFMCGPYPAFISFETGFHADLEVAFGNKDAVRAMLLDAALGVSIEAFAGLGFDLSLVAIQLGIYGEIGADVNFLLLTPSNASASNGTKLTIAGEIGIKLKVKVLFISYSKKFASTGFNWTKYWGNYKDIDKTVDGFWKGTRAIRGLTKSGRNYTMYLFDDGSTIVEVEGGAELESRDYLELAERSWKGGASGDMSDVQTNAYPYSHPAFTDDGEMFLYVSDNSNATKVESVVNYSVKNGNAYAEGVRVDTTSEQKDVLADLDVVASGTKDNAFAAWVKQVETPKRADQTAAVTNDEIGMMFNATEIYASAYGGGSWATTRLTNNYIADMSPAVASYGNKAIVAWRSMNASSMTASGTSVQDITAMFDVENNINYRVYDGSEWKTAQVAYNGNAGTVNAIDSAMLSDGTAILVYTVRTGKDVTTTETFYTVINANGETVTTGRLTNDSYTDTNAQVTAVNDTNGGYFVLGWYSEHDAGEGNTVEYELGTDGKPVYDENGKAKVKETKAVVAHDIRLARINANGSYDINFPESIGGTGETGISSDFHFSARANNTALTNVSVVWSQKKDSDKAEDAGKYELNAVRFFQADGVTGLTAPTDIAETDKNYTIDRFDTYTDDDGAIHAIILGTDYSTIEFNKVYDSIDLSKVTQPMGDDNPAEPDNLQILDGETVSSLKLATGTFPETAADVTADINISEVIPGFTTPVQFGVTNTGTSVINTVTANITLEGGKKQSKDFTVDLLPNQSATLIMSYNVPEGAVSDARFTVKSGETELGSGTLALNRPDVGISGIKLLQEHDGKRDIQVTLGNSSNIPLAGSGKTVKLAFYKDPFHEDKIGGDVSISADDFADIDEGTYTTVQTIDVTDIAALNADGEIPDEGLTVYARAWVDETEEPDVYNNDSFLSFQGLLTRNNGEKLTTDTSLEVNKNDQSKVTGYTVYADIRNNSMKETNVGIPVAVLQDASGNTIATKDFKDTSLVLGAEAQPSEPLSVTFTAEELKDKADPAQAVVRYKYEVSFDVNGGTGTFASIHADLDGRITTLPEGYKPTPPAVQAGEAQLFFSGWYTDKTAGELITNATFTESTTVYAQYVNHQHKLTYTASGTTITATCANTDGFCYLPVDETTHKHMATLTIAAPDSKTYTGTAIPAKITDANGIQGSAKVLYATKGENDTYSETVPVNVGSYKASLTLGEGDGAQTVSVEYEIVNAELSNVSVMQNGTLTYDGSTQTPAVNASATAVNSQTVTFTYSKTVDGTYGDMPTFTNVADAGTVYYKASAASHNDATGSFTVTMNKANQTAPAAPTTDNISATSITLKAVEGCEYSKDGSNWQDSTLFTGLTKETNYTFYQRLKETANYNASSSASASFTTTAHDHNWGGFSATGATISATCGNLDSSHPTGESLEGTMVINAPTLTTYGQTGDGISADATVTNGLGGIAVPAIIYKKGNDDLEAAPTDAGTYTASITLTGVDTGNGQTGNVTATVEYTIAKATPAAPTGVTATRTATSITVNTPAQVNTGTTENPIYKYEYSYRVKPADGATDVPDYIWGDSNVFTGLSPATTYQVAAREKETANYNAGTPSEALAVTTLPVITMAGTARYGRTLTVAEGYSYQWYRVDGNSVTEIPRATENTYTINKAEDIGKTLRVKVTVAGTDKVNEGVITADSAVVEVGLYTAPVLSVSKTTVTENTIKIDGFENYRADGKYKYSVDGGNTWTAFTSPFSFPLIISAEPNTTYSIVVQGVKVKSGATTVIEEGTPSVPLTVKTPAKVVPLTGVSINGTAQVGNTLSAKPEPADATSLIYQWQSSDSESGTYSNISGATYATYSLTKDDHGKYIRIVATQSGTGAQTSTSVQVEKAPAVEVSTNSIRATATNTSITVTAPRSTATRNYEYSLDNENWQTDNTFTFAPASEEAEKTVYVRTGGTDWQETGTEAKMIGHATVSVPVKPYPFDTAPTVVAQSFEYQGYTDGNVPALSIALKDGAAAPTFRYRVGASASGEWREWTAEAANSLSVGSNYYMQAVIAENDTYHAYTTEPVTFAVTQNTTETRPAPITAPTVSDNSLVVTIAEADRGKALEYQVDGTAEDKWASVPTLNSDGQFTLGALSAASHKVNLRYRADSNYQKPSASVESANFTLSQYSVAYDANGGSGAPAPQTATSPATITVYAKDDKAHMPTRSGYTFTGWYDAKDDGSEVIGTLSESKTLYAHWTPNTYTIAFNANGGTGTMGSIQNVAYDTPTEQKLTNTFTRSGYTFVGWATSAGGSVLYTDGQKVKNLTATQNGTVTLYAVWVADGKLVSGNVESGYPGTVELKLMRGSTQVGGTQVVSLTLGTDGKYTGTYNFTGIPNGTYNLVAMQIVARTDATGGEYEEALVRTAAVTVSDSAVSIGSGSNGTIVMPGGDASSEVAVKDDTPPVVVDGLDAEAASNSITDRSVSFTMTVESTNKSADGLGAETADAMDAIENQNSIGAAEELSYLNIGIEKDVLKDGTIESKETVTETEKVITICIPYDMTGKQAYQITFYRHHIDAQGNASTVALTRDSARSIGNEKDGHFYVDQTGNMIYLHTKLFSTYAIGYNPDAIEPATSNDPGNSGHSGHSGSSGGAIVYTPDISTPQHGKVSVNPKSASTGNVVTITAEPDEGYAVDTVTVTNQSGDKVRVTKVNETTYTFLQPAGKVKIDVSFKEAAPATTGPVTAPQPDVFDAFKDLDKDAWYRDGVKYVLENGIMNGMGDGIFAPNATTNRAMIVTMLWRMEGEPVVNYAMSYTDVDADAWYADAVRWAASEGIVTGYSETAFGPNDNVTREQLATILYRYAQSKGEGFKGAWMFLLDFPDAADVSAWADEAMHWMVMKEIITGMGDGTLNPGGEATRAQVATMLMRYHALTTTA